jgi:arylsulfatase A-like enzyme
MPDRLAAGVTTLAEAFRSAGWATFATSSVPFTGRLTNLHQGVEVLHERTSVPEPDHSPAKTARTFTDRLIDWLELQRDVPFFALLHVFDPHSPFEPYQPYPSLWMDAEEMAAHREDMEAIKEFIESPFMRYQSLPDRDEIARSGLDIAAYVEREKAWYDASIRAMDVEIDRLLEQLVHLGIDGSTLIVFMSDHGEEFLEHGRHFHGYNAYGEMLNVPLVFWWPAGLPGGRRVDATVESIDVMPTILELARLPLPEQIQGQSLLPLMGGSDPASLGWKPRPAVAERRWAPITNDGEVDVDVDSFAVVDGRWKLVWNTSRPDLRPEHELFDHRQDPLNLHDVARQHPEVVERLADYLERWRDSALAARVETEADIEEMSAEELETLRSLGYIN